MTQQRNDTPGPAAGGGQIQHALKLRDQFPSWLAPAQKVVWKNRQITLASSNFQPWEQFPADLFQSSSVKPAFMVDYQPKGSCHFPSGRGTVWLIRFLSGKNPFVVQLVVQATFLVATVPETNGINVLCVLGLGGGNFKEFVGVFWKVLQEATPQMLQFK